MAELLLAKEECRREVGDSAVLDVLLWHALEEAEHKAVAFDVYRVAGGSERMRIYTMRFTRFAFVIGMGAQVVATLAFDPATRRKGELRKSLRRLRRSPFLNREVWEMLKAYEREGFHPNDRPTDHLVAEWREKLFGAEGTLKVQLAGSGSTAA